LQTVHPPDSVHPDSPSAGTIIGVAAVIILVVLVGLWAIGDRDSGHFNPPETNFDIRVNKTAEGDWLMLIHGNSKPASTLTLQVANQTGEIVLKKTLASIKIPSGDPDAAYNDTDGNNNLNTGDTILLKASGGHVKAGCKVQILRGNIILGGFKELP
jgi:FlaG/FlaF family flagellin (archaellin)